MTSSDIALISTTIFLGAVALFVPFFAELLKRKLFCPVLKVSFTLAQPACHKTHWSNVPEESKKSVYYFRFEVENKGKSTCRNVENSIENVWKCNAESIPIKLNDFTPVNLKWSLNHEKTQQDINPGRRVFCNIGHLPTKSFQKAYNILIDPPGYEGDDLRLVLDLSTILNVQLNCVPPGSYIFQINTYSENHKTIEKFIKLNWSGRWSDDIDIMFKELVITETVRPKERTIK